MEREYWLHLRMDAARSSWPRLEIPAHRWQHWPGSPSPSFFAAIPTSRAVIGSLLVTITASSRQRVHRQPLAPKQQKLQLQGLEACKSPPTAIAGLVLPVRDLSLGTVAPSMVGVVVRPSTAAQNVKRSLEFALDLAHPTRRHWTRQRTTRGPPELR